MDPYDRERDRGDRRRAHGRGRPEHYSRPRPYDTGRPYNPEGSSRSGSYRDPRGSYRRPEGSDFRRQSPNRNSGPRTFRSDRDGPSSSQRMYGGPDGASGSSFRSGPKYSDRERDPDDSAPAHISTSRPERPPREPREQRIMENVLVTRPRDLPTKQGQIGKRVTLNANYFQLIQAPNWCLLQYRVDFNPDDDQTFNRRKLLRTAVTSLNLSGYIFDGTVLYTPRKLDPDPTELFVDPINETENDEKIKITIRLVGEVSHGDYHYLQVFNMIMRKCMQYLKLQLVGRNFFDPAAKISVPNFNLELWPGYITSIRQHERSILLCCEVTHKIMRRDTVYNLLEECYRDDNCRYQENFKEQILGSIVLTDYNNRTYRIDEVDFKSTPASTFTKKDGTPISFADYFKDRYGVILRSMDQPMLISQAKAREVRAGQADLIYLVPELCRMTGLTDQQRNNFQLMRAVAEHTRVSPSQKIQKLVNFSRRINLPEIVAELKQWNLKFAKDVVEFSGRILGTETLYGDRRTRVEYNAGPTVDWTKNVRDKKQFHDVPLKNWHILYPARCKQSVSKFLQNMRRATQGLQWQVGEPRSHEIYDDRLISYLDELEKISRERPQLVVCVVTNNKLDRYNAIKKKCCIERPVPTQVIQAKNLDSKKSGMSIATKVAIQMNCKVGGAPWTVDMKLSKLMVVGFDVSSNPSNRKNGFGALVCSIDEQATRYYSTVTTHSSNEELSNNFATKLIQGIKIFQKNNQCLPERLLIYRDSVGDGQIKYVFEHEVKIIKAALQEFYAQHGIQQVKMAYIIVTKRINTRIFNRGNNPEPGTVVDEEITLPERFDFYIVSQCTRQGTVSPTAYNVLHDSFGLSAEKIQILTYKLTHMYFNWSGTVSVPAPCQYAHKLSFLVAQALKGSPSPELETLLYYL